MTEPLFQPGQDWTILSGEIISIRDLDDIIAIDVKTDKGTFTGYEPKLHYNPQVGYTAKIKVYNIGGGWYPDDEIVGWSYNGRRLLRMQ